MKIRNILLGALVSVAVCANAQDTEFKYRRSSIYSVLVNHTNQQFAGEIKEAFLKIPVPDKFNDHNLSVKVLNLDKKLKGANSEKENAELTDFLSKNNVASRLVARWFNRDSYTGQCDMELVKERGLYNATEFDRQLAKRSARGLAMLQDAGEDLIGKYIRARQRHTLCRQEQRCKDRRHNIQSFGKDCRRSDRREPGQPHRQPWRYDREHQGIQGEDKHLPLPSRLE